MGKRVFILSVVLACVPAGRGEAAIIQFSDRATFEAAAGAVTVQDFEGFAPQADAFEGAPFDFGDFSAFNDPNGFSGGDIAVPPVANPEFGTTNVIFGATFIGGTIFQLTFDSPISAIGFDGGELADQRTDQVIFDNTAGDVVTISDSVDQLRFWGFISDTPFTTFTISQIGFGAGGGNGDGFSVDNLTYAVPEPATGLLVALGLALLRRRPTPARRPS
ncbi:MAG: PEP-CTERM sorting domain-containing protein [Proteobacteria bacterium]|nr:PEP-CTERM sorting domain-containing protein [Pseudomonadota bacterium]